MNKKTRESMRSMMSDIGNKEVQSHLFTEYGGSAGDPLTIAELYDIIIQSGAVAKDVDEETSDQFALMEAGIEFESQDVERGVECNARACAFADGVFSESVVTEAREVWFRCEVLLDRFMDDMRLVREYGTLKYILEEGASVNMTIGPHIWTEKERGRREEMGLPDLKGNEPV